MKMKKQHDRDEELARQLECDAEDEAMWEQEPVTIERRPTKTSVLSLRLPTAEFHALLSAARQAGESVSEYVRKAIAARQAAQPPTTFITTTCSNPASTLDSTLQQWRTLTAGSAQSVPQESATSTR